MTIFRASILAILAGWIFFSIQQEKEIWDEISRLNHTKLSVPDGGLSFLELPMESKTMPGKIFKVRYLVSDSDVKGAEAAEGKK